MTRIYLPATLAGLRDLRAKGEYQVPRVHAVTPGLREWYTEGSEEDLEYVAFTHAARAALALLDADRAVPARRVVIAADVAESALSQDGGRLGTSTTSLADPVSLSRIAAIHVDSAGAATEVAAAVAAWQAAEAGDDDAQFIVESSDDHELEWYDVSELDQLLAD